MEEEDQNGPSSH